MKKIFLPLFLILVGVVLTLSIQKLLTNKEVNKNDNVSAQETMTFERSNTKQNESRVESKINNKIEITEQKKSVAQTESLNAEQLNVTYDAKIQKMTLRKNDPEKKKIPLEDRFNHEEIDYQWKLSQEDKIFNLLNDNVFGEDAWIENTECKSSLCKVEINYSSAAVPLIEKTLKVKPKVIIMVLATN